MLKKSQAFVKFSAYAGYFIIFLYQLGFIYDRNKLVKLVKQTALMLCNVRIESKRIRYDSITTP